MKLVIKRNAISTYILIVCFQNHSDLSAGRCPLRFDALSGSTDQLVANCPLHRLLCIVADLSGICKAVYNPGGRDILSLVSGIGAQDRYHLFSGNGLIRFK